MQVSSLLTLFIFLNRFETVVQRTVCGGLINQAGSILVWRQQVPWHRGKLPPVMVLVNGGAKESGLALFARGRTDWWCGTTRHGDNWWDIWGVKDSGWYANGSRKGDTLGCKGAAMPGGNPANGTNGTNGTDRACRKGAVDGGLLRSLYLCDSVKPNQTYCGSVE
jgi:hypothetical protein